MGEGEVLNVLDIGENCKTGITSCKIDELRGATFPWSLTLTLEKNVEISGIELDADLADRCIGLPPVMSVSGTVVGQFFDYVPPPEPSALGTPATIDSIESPGLSAAASKRPSTAL